MTDEAPPIEDGLVERLLARLIAVRDSQVPTGDDTEIIVDFDALIDLFDAGYEAADTITRLLRELGEAREALELAGLEPAIDWTTLDGLSVAFGREVTKLSVPGICDGRQVIEIRFDCGELVRVEADGTAAAWLAVRETAAEMRQALPAKGDEK